MKEGKTISKKYAIKLEREGKAVIHNFKININGIPSRVVNRLDKNRIDVYEDDK